MEKSFFNYQFLCGLLNIGANHAMIEGAEKTLEVLSSVSELVRYLFDDRKVAVSLKDEFIAAENYLELQNMRDKSGCMFHIQLNCSDEELQIKHLSLLQQLIQDVEEYMENPGAGKKIEYIIKDEKDAIILGKASGKHGSDVIALTVPW